MMGGEGKREFGWHGGGERCCAVYCFWLGREGGRGEVSGS